MTGRQYLTSYYDADLARFRYAQLVLTDPDSILSVAEGLGPVDVLVNAAVPVVRKLSLPLIVNSLSTRRILA